MSSAAPWRSVARGRIWSDEPLAKHTSFRIGGPADWFAEPEDLDDLQTLLMQARRWNIPVLLIGGGTNLLASDRGFHGLAIHLRRPFFTHTVLEQHADPSAPARLWCGAGVVTNRLVTLAAQEGWGGVERLAGLPGTIGGAVVMNAQEIGQFVEAVVLVDLTGSVHHVRRDALRFHYRYTELPDGVVVRVQLAFPRVPPAEAAAAIHQLLGRRKATQELSLSSAGCAFKNPQGGGKPAGQLIERSGFKGASVGGAQVSLRHANFIVNMGQAKALDVLELMERIQVQVHRDHGVWLEPELRILGERIE